MDVTNPPLSACEGTASRVSRCSEEPSGVVQRALMRLFPQRARSVSCGLGVLIAPSWVLTCEHVASPRTGDFGAALCANPSLQARVSTVVFAGESLRIDATQFLARFGQRSWGTSDYLQERLALLQLDQPLLIAPPYPRASRDGDPDKDTLLGAPHFGAAPRLMAELRFVARASSNCVMATLPEFALGPMGGDSGGPVIRGSASNAGIFAIQNAVSIDHLTGVRSALAVPVATATTWISNITGIPF